MSLTSRHFLKQSRLALSIIMAVTMNAPIFARAESRPTAPAAKTLKPIESPASANKVLLNWLENKEANVSSWMNTRADAKGIPDFIDYHIVRKEVPLSPLTASEAKIAAGTKELYDEYFPRENTSSYVGTFFESGNPLAETARGPYQWDSIKVAGLDQPGVFKAAVNKAVQAGIKSIRIGPFLGRDFNSNSYRIKIGQPESWNEFMEKIQIIWAAGATPTISVAFFPSLERWKVLGADGKVDYSRSYLLNTSWPSDMGRMASDMMDALNARAADFEKRTGKTVKFVINPINEPETLAGFNRHFWHGAFANWSSPELMKYYIPSVINIAKANVAIRQAVLNKAQGRRILFMHNEAMTPIYYPSHKGPGRFAVSKFMLGDDSIVRANFDTYLNPKTSLATVKSMVMPRAKHDTSAEVHWAIREFAFGKWNTTKDSQKQALKYIVAQLKELQSAHLNLKDETGRSTTVKTDNMLWMDYYYQTEFILNRPIPVLIKDLAANHGDRLRKVLGAHDSQTMLRMIRTAAADAEKKMPGVKLLSDSATVSEIDFEQLLSQEDSALFESLIGIRNEFTYAKDPITTARRAPFKLFDSKVYRTDELLAKLLDKDAQLLFKVLGASNKAELLALFQQAGTDTTDGGPVVHFSTTESFREILNKNDRKILERLFGITRERLLGFEPNHYARHLRLGIRDGFYKFAMDYINALRLHTVGVGESGTPFYVFAPLLHDQVMMEYAHVLKSGVYGTQYAFGPAVDTRGWAKGPLSLHYADDHEINPSGLFSLVKQGEHIQVIDRTFVPETPGWAKVFLKDFFSGLTASNPGKF